MGLEYNRYSCCWQIVLRVERLSDFFFVFFPNSDANSHLLLSNLLEFLFQTTGSCYLLLLVAVDVLPFLDVVVNAYSCS